jgi:hypothetical protein
LEVADQSPKLNSEIVTPVSKEADPILPSEDSLVDRAPGTATVVSFCSKTSLDSAAYPLVQEKNDSPIKIEEALPMSPPRIKKPPPPKDNRLKSNDPGSNLVTERRIHVPPVDSDPSPAHDFKNVEVSNVVSVMSSIEPAPSTPALLTANSILELQPVSNEVKVVGEGHFRKEGSSFKTWKSRFYVISGSESKSEAILEYFHPKSRVSKGCVNLMTLTVSTGSSKNLSKSGCEDFSCEEGVALSLSLEKGKKLELVFDTATAAEHFLFEVALVSKENNIEVRYIFNGIKRLI